MLLATDVHVPVRPDSDVEPETRLGGWPEAMPLREDHVELAFMASQYNGLPVINMFDTEARLRSFMARRQLVDFAVVQLPVSELIESLHGDAYLFLNPETPFQMFIVPADVRMLRGWGGAPRLNTAASAGTLQAMSPVPDPSDDLVDAVIAAARTQDAVRRLWLLGQHGEASVMIVEIDDGLSLTQKRRIADAFGRSLQGAIGDGAYLDIAPVTSAEVDRFVPPDAMPIYERDG